MGSRQPGECVSRRSTSALGGAYSRLPRRVRSVEKKMLLTPFLGGDELRGARALQRFFSAFEVVECLVDGACDSGFLYQAPMALGGCRLVDFGFPFIDVFVERVHGSGVSRMSGGGRGRDFRGALIFLTRAEEAG